MRRRNVYVIIFLVFFLMKSSPALYWQQETRAPYPSLVDIEVISTFSYDFNNGKNRNSLLRELQADEPAERMVAWDRCEKLIRNRFFDFSFLWKILRNLNPFSKPLLQMRFFLFKRNFPDCGREIELDNMSLDRSGFNSQHPTRILIHGWMSQSRGSFNRDIKDAYLTKGEFNVIVTDWSVIAANLNYFSVANIIEGLGSQLADFTRYLHAESNVSFDDIYLIGHSLGAQIAGAAGKRLHPDQYNTIFALDPAGPWFRRRSEDFRVDPTDARYVESIHTSLILGFSKPSGNATFYPNHGFYQNKCFYIGCSHIRAYKLFAESIISKLGFWGQRCFKRTPLRWDCNMKQDDLYSMGGEPSVPKNGVFYVKTHSVSPYAIDINS